MNNDMRWLAELGSDDDAVQSAIAMLRNVSSSPERLQEAQSSEAIIKAANTVAMSYTSLQEKLKKLAEQLTAMQSLVDRNLSDFCDGLALYIDNDKTAFNAQQIYDARWFQTLPYSQLGKIAIAARLIAAVSVFDPTYVLPLWKMVIAYDSDALDMVSLKAKTSKITGLSFYSPPNGSVQVK